MNNLNCTGSLETRHTAIYCGTTNNSAPNMDHETSCLYSKLLFLRCKKLYEKYLLLRLEDTTEIVVLQKQLVDFLCHAEKLFESGKCDKQTFKAEVLGKLRDLPLEVLWFFHVSNIISIKEYVEKMDMNSFDTELINSLVMCTLTEKSTFPSFSNEMCADFLTVLLSGDGIALNHLRCQFIHKIVSVMDLHETVNVSVLLGFFISSASKSETVQSLKSFWCVFLNSLWLSHEVTSLKKLFEEQVTDFHKKPLNNEEFSKLFTQLFTLFDSMEIMKIIKDCVLKNQINLNWSQFLNFLFYYGHSYSDGPSNLKQFVVTLLDISFSDLNNEVLACAFLVGRYCCANNFDCFTSYLQWFSSSFSADSSRPVNTKPLTEFFIGFLTELVEMDSAFYLKVHINRVPSVPMDCHHMVSDYVKIVKAKLASLNDTPELGLYNNTNTKISSSEFDVEMVLKHFSQFNELPKCVMEASLFCKSYYEKKFLVELLSRFEGKKSSRHQVIEKLHALCKIPSSLFTEYGNLVIHSVKNK